MIDKDLKYNGEHYSDPTACKAISNVMNNNFVSKAGELWEFRLKSGAVKSCIVLADNDKAATILPLTENPSEYTDIEVNCHGLMYTTSGMIQYAFSNMFESYIRTLSDKEFEEIRSTVAATLGIDRKETVKVQKEVEYVEVEKEPITVVQESDESILFELERTKAQLEVYKELYKEMLQKAVS